MEEDILSRIEDNFQEAISDRSPRESKWREVEQYYRGKHWKVSINRPYKNHIFSIIEGEVPIIVDGSPASDVVAKKERDIERVKILSDCLKYVYSKNNLQLLNSEVARALLKTGTGFIYVDYDPDAENGEGMPTYRVLPWRYCFPDPAATNIDECSYFYLRIPMREAEVRRRYHIPEEVELPLVTLTMDLHGNYSTIGTDGKKSYFPNHDAVDSGDPNTRHVDMCLLDICFMKDYERVQIPDEETTEEIAQEMQQFMQMVAPDINEYMDHDEHIAAHLDAERILAAQALEIDVEMVTEADIQNLQADAQLGVILQMIRDHRKAHEEFKKINPEGTKPKYEDNMRLVIKVGDYIIIDGENPVQDGLYPIVPFYCYKDENGFWGIGEGENVIPIQKTINELEWAELQGLKLNSNSGWLVDEESKVEASTLTNDPGLVVVKKQGTEVTRIQPGAVSPQLAQRIQSEQLQAREIAGVNQVSQGEIPGSITAASAIQSLQAQSLTRMRLKKKYFWEYSEPRLARLTLSRIIKFWNSERELRLYDNEGQIRYVKFNPSDIDNLDYEVTVVPMALENADKESVERRSDKLLQMGVLDPKTYVQINDFPHKGRIIQSIEERDELKLQLQQMMMENEQLKGLIEQGVAATNPTK